MCDGLCAMVYVLWSKVVMANLNHAFHIKSSFIENEAGEADEREGQTHIHIVLLRTL
jgi:hypothetical protein